MKDTDQLLYDAKKSVEHVSTLLRNDLFYQYGYCSSQPRENIVLYIQALQRHRQQLIEGEPCLCCEEVQQLFENTRTSLEVRTGQPRTDLQVDDAQLAAWTAANPGLVAYEDWERCVYECASLLTFTVKAQSPEEICKAVQVVLKLNDALNKVDCDLKYDLQTQDITCKLDTQLIPDKVSCEIEYELLTTAYDCDLTLEMYTTLLQCGLTHEVISQALECGVGLTVKPSDVADSCAVVQVVEV